MLLNTLALTAGQAQDIKLIYVGDPMCSWCYGIAEELTQTVDHYGDALEVELVMGGLRAGGGEEWNQNFRDFLRHHWEDVSARSGQPFSYDLLDSDSFDYDTEPACRSVVVAMQMAPQKGLSFFKAVQRGFYLGNRDPKDVNFYQPICKDLELDFDTFSKLFDSTEMKRKTNEHFERSAQLGARSFPTIILLRNGKYELVASGYATADKMIATIGKL